MFALLYGITVHEIKSYSAAYKGGESGHSITTWKDSHVHDITMAETENIWKINNLGQPNREMLVSAMSTGNNRDMMTSEWLERFFELCDQSPSSDFTRVPADKQIEIYERYIASIGTEKWESEPVDIARFGRLWNSLYPHCRYGQECRIPGSCSTCADIDRWRRTSTDEIIHKMCQEAHHIHRGGLFLLERKQ